MELAYRQGRAKLPGGNPVGEDGYRAALTVQCYRKTTDPDLAFLAPVKLQWTDNANPGPQAPADFPYTFPGRPLCYALSPGSGNEGEAVGIAAAAIPAGRFGPVYVSGEVFCPVNVTDVTHPAAVLGTSATELKSAASGLCRILWRKTNATGVQTCGVLLNAGGSGGGDASFWAEITGSSGGAEPATLYSWKKKVLDSGTHLFVDGVGTGTNTLKRVPSNVAAPVIPTGHVVRAWPSPTDPGKYECPATGGLYTVTVVTAVACVDGELAVTTKLATAVDLFLT